MKLLSNMERLSKRPFSFEITDHILHALKKVKKLKYSMIATKYLNLIENKKNIIKKTGL